MLRRRPVLRTIQDWWIFEDAWLKAPQGKRENLLALRRAVYADIEAARGRPLLVYFADIENPAKAPFSAIEFKDINGFADLVGECADSASVDVLLQSRGGSPEITARIVDILRNRFEEVHFLIPHSAYSAATMLALSGDSITLHPAATLGPIDPQFGRAPAANILRGFENAIARIKENPAIIPVLLPLIEPYYTLNLLEQCKHAAELSKDLAGLWLKRYMFKGRNDREEIIKAAVKYFSDFDEHHAHGRPIGWSSVKDMGLNISLAEGNLAALLREAYLLLQGFFNMSPHAKMYENSSSLTYAHTMPLPPPPPNLPSAQEVQEMIEQTLKNLPPEIVEQMKKDLQKWTKTRRK